MANVTVKGKNALDETKKVNAVKWLAENASTEELEKLVKLAKNPAKRAMLKMA